MQITEEFLIEKGFNKHWSSEHNYCTQFTKYFDEVERSISFVSTESFGIEGKYTKLDVWFWGLDPNKMIYCDLDSHLQVSTTEEVEFLLNLLKN